LRYAKEVGGSLEDYECAATLSLISGSLQESRYHMTLLLLHPVAQEAKLFAGGYVVRCDAWRRRGRDVTRRDVGPFRGVDGWISSVHRAGLMGGRDFFTYIAAHRP